METKKVKIIVAVVVDNTGDWTASGWKRVGEDLQVCFDVCFDSMAENDIEEKWIIEAEIDIPTRSLRTIKGTATKQIED